jgi:hypothetical protein
LYCFDRPWFHSELHPSICASGRFQSIEITDVDIYTFQLPQPQQEVVQHLRAFIAHEYPELTESLKWHVPVYSLNTTNYLLGLQVFKRHVNLIFFRVAQLDDPKKILAGSGKQVLHITLRTINDIDESALQALIDQTIVIAR